MKKSKVISRQLTNKGLLINFGEVNCLLSVEKIAVMNSIGIKAPNIGDEVTIKPSVDAAGLESSNWVDLVV